MQNKANLLNAKILVNCVLTMDYANIRLHSRFKNKAKQSQFKPNLPDAQMSVNPILTKDYEKNNIFAVPQNKANSNPIKPNSNPIQTQFQPKYAENKPNQTQFQTICTEIKPNLPEWMVFSLFLPAEFNRIIMVNNGVFVLFSRIYSEVKMKIRTIASIILVLFLFPAIGLAQDIYVYTVDMTEAHTQLVSNSPYVTPTASGDANLALDPDANLADFVVGVSAGNVGGDPCVPQHNLYAYKITDPCTAGPKTKVVIATGNHNSETSGSWAFQGMVDYILSADPNAQWLRQLAEFYIYPLVNPDGRYTGTGRGNPEMTAEGFGTDHNRVWNRQGEGLSTIDALTTAMQNDTGGDADYLFDFHSGGSNYFNTISDLMDCPFVLAFLALDIGVGPSASAGQPGMSRIWSMTPAPGGLSVEYAFTPEQDKSQPVSYYLGLGGYYALALHNTLAEDVTDYNDLKILADNWLADNLTEQTGELVGFWNFDDGTADDSSGNGHHGTLVAGDGTTSINIVYDGDRDSNVLELNNPAGHTINSVVDCGGAGDWADIRTRISIAAWIKVDTFHVGNQYLLTKGNTYQLTRSGTTNAMRSYMDGLSDTALSSGATVNDGSWHHVAVTYDSNSSERIIYIDGQDSGSDTPSGSLNVHPETFVIGGRLNTSFDHRGWDGRVDDVRLYDYVLTPNDVDLIYQGSEPCEPSGFICAGNPPGDLNDDCKVNFLDYALLANDWLK